MDIRFVKESLYCNLESNDVIEVNNKRVNEVENEKTKYNKSNLKNAVEDLNKVLKAEDAYAEYNVHDFFGDILIKIVDNKTKEVLMECPPKKVIDLVAKLCEINGVLIDKEA